MGSDLAESLEIKLYDKEWDVRDNVVEFIGSLFAPVSPFLFTWAVEYAFDCVKTQ